MFIKSPAHPKKQNVDETGVVADSSVSQETGEKVLKVCGGTGCRAEPGSYFRVKLALLGVDSTSLDIEYNLWLSNIEHSSD